MVGVVAAVTVAVVVVTIWAAVAVTTATGRTGVAGPAMAAGQRVAAAAGDMTTGEVVAEGETLDRLGVVVDFEHLKEAVGEICRRFHYADITSHPDFAGQSPSAEAVARYFFREVRRAMGPEGERLARVRVWEAPGCSASYRE